MKHLRTNAAGRHARQQGFTLVEMMIAVTIGLAIIAALAGVLAANSGQSYTNDRTSELNTNGRFALNSMKQELRQAGYRGYTQADPTVSASIGLPTTPATSTCFQTGSSYEAFVGNLRQGVWGATATNPFSGSCIPGGRYSTGSDVLVVRRLSGTPVTTLAAGSVYFHSTFSVGQMFIGTTPPAFGTVSPLGDFDVHVYVYYISRYTTSSTEVPLVPSLRRVSLDSTGKMVDELVASGIEHMHVQYSRLTTAPATRWLSASGIVGNSYDSPATNTGYEWDQVQAVQVWLIARTAAVEPGYANTQTYVMGDTSVTKNDGYRRELFTSVIQLRNPTQ